MSAGTYPTRRLLDWDRADAHETAPLQSGLLACQASDVSRLCRNRRRLARDLARRRSRQCRRGREPPWAPWPTSPVEAAIWKIIADAAADGHLLVDLERFALDRTLPLARLSPDAAPIVPDPLPDTLLPEPVAEEATASLESGAPVPGPTFDASTLDEKHREQFHRNLRAVEQVLAGAPQTRIAAESGIPRSTLGRLVRRTRELGQIGCRPHGSYRRSMTMHPALTAARFLRLSARQVLVDRLQIITGQAPPYCPSAKGTVEALFRWMTQRFERRLPKRKSLSIM
jgi:hypothetical protein